jgi:transcriptional regulator with GAF, ATPase, and Fis domain
LAPRGQGFFAELAPVITRISQSTLNIVVLGETGVGKEVLARRIHAESPRAKRPLVSINCAALHEVLLESELFGHERGAFTGAVASKVGLIESAEGGTVFLDELGEMPPSLQVKLLRVLEQREVLRVGSVRPRPIDVRFIAATNRDLELDVEQGRFRKDLYFRLNGYFFYIPPLRERPAEIIPLADKFVLEACLRTGRQPLELSGDVKAILESYEWPGNVRELRTSMDRAVTLAVGPQVLPEHLPLDRMRMSGRWVSSLRDKVSVVDPATSKVLPSIEEDEESLALAKARVPRGSDEERRRVLEALARCGGNQTQAARMLGISRGTLISRMEDYGLARPRKGVGP